MRPQHDDFFRLHASCERDLEIDAGDTAHVAGLTHHQVTPRGPMRRDVVGWALVQIGDRVDVFRIAKDVLSSRQDGIPRSGRSGIFEA